MRITLEKKIQKTLGHMIVRSKEKLKHRIEDNSLSSKLPRDTHKKYQRESCKD